MAFGKKDNDETKPAKVKGPTGKELLQMAQDRKEAQAYRVRYVSHFAKLGSETAMDSVLNEMHNQGYTLVAQSTVQVAGPTIASYFTFYREPDNGTS